MNISQSKLNTYSKCPYLYKFQYVDGVKFPPTPALIRGTVAHKVIEHCCDILPQKKNIRQIYSDCAKSILAELGTNLSKREYAEVYYSTISVLDVFYARYPANKPVSVEQKFALPYKSITITGRFDMIDILDGVLYITDYKTGRFIASDWLSLLHSFQTVLYHWAAEQIYRRQVKVKYWWLRWDEQRELNILPEITSKVFRRMNNIIAKINLCQFEPTPGSMCQTCPAMTRCIPGQKYVVDNIRHYKFQPQSKFNFV